MYSQKSTEKEKIINLLRAFTPNLHLLPENRKTNEFVHNVYKPTYLPPGKYKAIITGYETYESYFTWFFQIEEGRHKGQEITYRTNFLEDTVALKKLADYIYDGVNYNLNKFNAEHFIACTIEFIATDKPYICGCQQIEIPIRLGGDLAI